MIEVRLEIDLVFRVDPKVTYLEAGNLKCNIAAIIIIPRCTDDRK